MKSLFAAIVIFFLFFSASLSAQELDKKEEVLVPFSLTLIGTPHFSDVDAVRRSLARSSLVREVWQARAMRGMVELHGVFEGEYALFREEVEVMIQDRFRFDAEQVNETSVQLTLRKIGS